MTTSKKVLRWKVLRQVQESDLALQLDCLSAAHWIVSDLVRDNGVYTIIACKKGR